MNQAISDVQRQNVNLKRIEHLTQQISALNAKMVEHEQYHEEYESDLKRQVEAMTSQARRMDEQIKTMNRFFMDKSNEREKVQKVMDSFKDRLMDKFRQVSDDMSKKLQMSMTAFEKLRQEVVASNLRVAAQGTEVMRIDSQIKVVEDKLEGFKEDVDEAKRTAKLSDRIIILEK